MLEDWHPALLRAVGAVGVTAAYLALCGTIALRERRKERRIAAAEPAAGDTRPWLVAFASQTGFAEQLAWQSAQALQIAGLGAHVRPLGTLTAADLREAGRALFIVSTHGEGDPPDAAAAFVRARMNEAIDLAHLRHAVLALGDRQYARFCGFGRTLAAWLAERGSGLLFPVVELDNRDPESLARWRRELGRLAGTADLPDWQAPAFERWRLAERHHLNPGSVGGPMYRLRIEAETKAAATAWESGDIAQVLVPHDPAQRPREYSIASVRADAAIELLVRQERHADGSPGLASGWLTQGLAIGGSIALRIRAHPAFRLGGNVDRPLVLVGNGSGLAGLRGHLKARAALGGARRHWLVFGERQARHDFHCREEIEAWQAAGVLERVDLVFSRDGPQRRHVQDLLRDEAGQVRRWIAAGAAIYVCGSLDGMAGGVQQALVDILGQSAVDGLVEAGRYRRDVY